MVLFRDVSVNQVALSLNTLLIECVKSLSNSKVVSRQVPQTLIDTLLRRTNVVLDIVCKTK